MDRTLLGERLEAACETFSAVERQLADPAVAADPSRLQHLARERARLEPLVQDYRNLEKHERERQEARTLLRSVQAGDPGAEELAALASEELESLEASIEALMARLTVALLPRRKQSWGASRS